jgi:hypothetical protein
MAKLVSTPKAVRDLVELKFTGDFNQEYKRTTAGLDEVLKKYDTLSFPRGDGYAIYGVKRYAPLEVFHVPFGDAYCVEVALIRGLTERDVREQVRREKRMRSMFPKALSE